MDSKILNFSWNWFFPIIEHKFTFLSVCCPVYQCHSYTVRLLSFVPVSFLHCLTAFLCISVLPTLFDGCPLYQCISYTVRLCPLYQCPSYTARRLSFVPVSSLPCWTALLCTSVLRTLFDCCPLYQCPSYTVRLLSFVPMCLLHCSTSVLCTSVLPTLFDCLPLHQCPSYTARLLSFVPYPSYTVRLQSCVPMSSVSLLHCCP